MQTFYFDTGVRPQNCNGLCEGQVWRNGTKQIPFDVTDVPENAELMFLAPTDDLPESKLENVIVRSVHNTTMAGDFAYFKVYKPH